MGSGTESTNRCVKSRHRIAVNIRICAAFAGLAFLYAGSLLSIAASLFRYFTAYYDRCS